MAQKPTDTLPNRDTQGGDAFQQVSEKRLLELLDEIYELEQFRREQLTLRRLSSYLMSALTRDEAYAAVERFGPQLWPGATGALYCFHLTEAYLERVAAWGDASLEESLELRDCWAMRRAQPHCVKNTGTELPCEHITHLPEALPSLCVPLIAQGRTLGLFHLQRLTIVEKTAGNGVSENPAVTLATMLAEDLSFALANMSLRESIHEQSLRDSLTGLFNRRFFEEFLIRELARAGRKTHQISVVVLDLDHFKRINDTFGHGAGDMVLRRVGPVLQANVRESDVACRIGGEEFLLLLSESTLPIAVQRAERIRKALREMSLTYEDKKVGPITASFGAAAYPDHGNTVEALFRAADEALYHAKRGGRDRVIPARLSG